MSQPFFIGPDPLPFPTELTLRDQWLCFRLWTEPGDPKLRKMPMNPATGLPAASDNPATWTDYWTALKAVREGRYEGLGFVLTPETRLAVLDLEACVEDGVVAEWAQREVSELDSFTEISASGTGLHVLVWGEVPGNLNRQKVRAELWGDKKMFCFTGLVLQGRTTIEERSLLPLHTRIERGEIGPDYEPPRIPINVHSQKFRDTCADQWQTHYASRSDAVMGVLVTLANEHGENRGAIREAFEATALCGAWTDAGGRSKWDRLGEKQIEKAIAFTLAERVKDRLAETSTQAPSDRVTFTRAAVPGRMQDYVLKAIDEFDGWLPRGAISMIGGSSGAGKTTLMVDLLARQALGETVLGHEGARLPYLILFADRGGFQNAETFKRMRLDPDRVPHGHLRPVFGVEAAARICQAVEAQPLLPAVVFIEGADTLVEDPNRVAMVTAFLSALQKIAEHYHIAIVLSVGAPKTKPNEQYALRRDRLYGSQMWPRMSATIILVSQIPESGIREVHVEHRNAPSEDFEMEFQNGRMVQRTTPSATIDPLRAWVEARRDGEEWFTRAEAVTAMEVAGAGMKRTAVHDRIKKWTAAGELEEEMAHADGHAVVRLRIKRTAAERVARRQEAAVEVGW